MFIRGEVAVPLQNLADKVDSKVGGGAALGLEFPLEDGWRWRAEVGHDPFPKGTSKGVTAMQGQVSASHLDVEGVYQLREPRGPYLLFGLGAYSWEVKDTDLLVGTTTSRRVAHVAGVFGFGYRVGPHLDLEVRGVAGKVDPTLTAAWVAFSLGWRF